MRPHGTLVAQLWCSVNYQFLLPCGAGFLYCRLSVQPPVLSSLTSPQVFQRRVDGFVDICHDWAAYKQGFGSQLGEFWLENDNIHALTAQGRPCQAWVAVGPLNLG